MQRLLGHKIDKIYFCPHREENNCSCRKPKAGMLLQAKSEFNLDIAASFILGDTDKDILAGQTVGCRTIFIKNKFHEHSLARCSPDFVVKSLPDVPPLI